LDTFGKVYQRRKLSHFDHQPWIGRKLTGEIGLEVGKGEGGFLKEAESLKHLFGSLIGDMMINGIDEASHVAELFLRKLIDLLD